MKYLNECSEQSNALKASNKPQMRLKATNIPLLYLAVQQPRVNFDFWSPAMSTTSRIIWGSSSYLRDILRGTAFLIFFYFVVSFLIGLFGATEKFPTFCQMA
jgi:hypothetical protein